jgi:hypothetical protein
MMYHFSVVLITGSSTMGHIYPGRRYVIKRGTFLPQH